MEEKENNNVENVKVEENTVINEELLKEQLREEITEELINKNKNRKIRRYIFKFLVFLFWVFIIFWIYIMGSDYLRVAKNQEPKYCLKTETKKYVNGEINICSGLGYKTLKYKSEDKVMVEFGGFWIQPKEEMLIK